MVTASLATTLNRHWSLHVPYLWSAYSPLGLIIWLSNGVHADVCLWHASLHAYTQRIFHGVDILFTSFKIKFTSSTMLAQSTVEKVAIQFVALFYKVINLTITDRVKQSLASVCPSICSSTCFQSIFWTDWPLNLSVCVGGGQRVAQNAILLFLPVIFNFCRKSLLQSFFVWKLPAAKL